MRLTVMKLRLGARLVRASVEAVGVVPVAAHGQVGATDLGQARGAANAYPHGQVSAGDALAAAGPIDALARVSCARLSAARLLPQRKHGALDLTMQGGESGIEQQDSHQRRVRHAVAWEPAAHNAKQGPNGLLLHIAGLLLRMLLHKERKQDKLAQLACVHLLFANRDLRHFHAHKVLEQRAQDLRLAAAPCW